MAVQNRRVVEIVSTKRLKNSVNGNPRWMLTTRQGEVLRTKPDTGFVFGIVFDDLRGWWNVSTDGLGRVVDMSQ